MARKLQLISIGRCFGQLKTLPISTNGDRIGPRPNPVPDNGDKPVSIDWRFVPERPSSALAPPQLRRSAIAAG
jgi:hypothetical protein